MDMLEESHYTYQGGNNALEIAAPSPDAEMIAAVQHGVFEFALYNHREVLLFCYRIKGALEWQSIPYNIHFADGDEIVLPQYPFLHCDKIRLHISLLDSETEEVKARRTVALSRNFSLELASVLRRQASYPFNRDNFVMTQTCIDTEHRGIEDIIQNATIRCMGEWCSSKDIANVYRPAVC